ncbi:MAG: DUF1993 domain-containing protein [Devosia sp.]|nr:DUF1993 domain-containing protein [Devosia sp.]
MTISMYSASVPVFTRMLRNLLAILEKAEANAAERRIKPEVLAGARLAPDMYPLSFQIQSATDRTKFFVARVTGQQAPSWADDEQTLADLRARINKGLEFLATVRPEELDGTEEKLIPLKVRGEEVRVRAQDYLLNNVTPNFYFHVTTAYDILRHNGVPIGKRDFVG